MLLLLVIPFAQSWIALPHRMIARIAQRLLTDEDNEYLNSLLSTWPEETGTIINLAAWHDKVRTSMTGPWHFVNIPIIDPSYTRRYPDPVYNASDLIREHYGAATSPGFTSPWAKSFMVRGLVHMVGDIHCPGHSVNRYTSTSTSGDAGGNGLAVYVEYSEEETNLHSYWDGALDLYSISTSWLNQTQFELNVTEVMTKYPQSMFASELREAEPQRWAEGVYQISKEFMYGKLPPPDKDGVYVITQQYAEAGRPPAQKMIALAGYRLWQCLRALIDGKPSITDDGQQLVSGKSNAAVRATVVWVIDGILAAVVVVHAVLLFLKIRGDGKDEDP
jgi:hypothetical protein